MGSSRGGGSRTCVGTYTLKGKLKRQTHIYYDLIVKMYLAFAEFCHVFRCSNLCGRWSCVVMYVWYCNMGGYPELVLRRA